VRWRPKFLAFECELKVSVNDCYFALAIDAKRAWAMDDDAYPLLLSKTPKKSTSTTWSSLKMESR
jgi:hypothetical protein